MSKRVLIVDDDSDQCFMVEKRLRKSGYECQSVLSVKEALEILGTFKPDLILLDLMFRGPNGTAFLQTVKKILGRHGNIPVLVVSGCNEEEVIDYVLENGASGFIKKPADPAVLLSMINEYIH